MVNLIVRECCCGCSLRSGTLAIGVYNTIEGLIGVIVYFIIAFSENSENEKKSIYIVSAVICIVEMIASICLIYGAVKEKRRFITPWLVTTAILLVSYFVIVNVSLFLVVAAGSSVVFSLGGFISVALMIYFLIVVYSYHESFLVSSSGGHVIAYAVESPRYPGSAVMDVPPQDFYPQNFPHQQEYPQYLQPAYPQQPPPYDAPGTFVAGASAPFPPTHGQKLQP